MTKCISFGYFLFLQNAIEVFKDVLKLKPDHVEASTSLGQAFRYMSFYKIVTYLYLISYGQWMHDSYRHVHIYRISESIILPL